MKTYYHLYLGLLICALQLFTPHFLKAADAPLDIGGRLELFVDSYLVDKFDNTELKLHEPRDEGEVLRYDKPWEGQFCAYNTVIYDGDIYRVYYRGKRVKAADGVSEVTCYAESKDGITWTKPALGLHEADGSKANNIILAMPGVTHNFSPFLDTRPGVPAEERFKALGGVQTVGGGLYALVSADGIHWKKLQKGPVLTKGAFDSQNVAFWSEEEGCYVACFRTFTAGKVTAKEWKPSGYRSVSRATSSDFLNWSDTVPMQFEPAQEVHLYINQTHPYFRAPNLWISTSARFMQGRRAITAREEQKLQVTEGYAGDVSDCVLLTSRDGRTYQQTFREAFIRPSLRQSQWVSRTGYPALNVVQTGPEAMSLYVNQDYTQPTAHLRRYSMRLDGFASVNAPYKGGEMLTKPLQFKGRHLMLNFATSAAGSIRVEIQDEAGKPLPGYTAAECVELLGNRISWPVRWKNGGDLSELAGRPVRLRFVMKDADIFSLRFVEDYPVESPGDNLVYVSWGDQIMVAKGDAQLDTPDKIERCIAGWADNFEAGTILWRGSFLYIKEFYDRRPAPGFISEYYKKVEKISSEFSPLDVVRRETRKHGQKMMIYMTVFDHGAPTNRLYGGSTPFPWQDRETIAHPEWQTVDRKGVPHYGVLDFSWPEARSLMVNRIKEYVKRFDCDGVYVCTRTHSLPALHADQFGFGPKIVAEFKKRTGVDILSDPRFDYTSPKYAPGDPLLDQWRRLRGEYLVQFYRDLRSALPGRKIITGIPRGRYLGPPYGNLYLDWEKIVGEKLVDGLVLNVVSGAGLHPPLRVPHKTIGYLSSEDDQIAIPSNHDCVQSIYGPLCREKGVNLYLRSGYGKGFAKWVKQEPNLTGAMIGCPSSAPSPGLAHDDALNFADGEMTVEAFLKVNPDRFKEWQRVLSKYDHENDNQARGWEWIILPDGRFRFRINLCEPNTREPGQDIALDTKEALPVGQWIHIATVYDRPNCELRLYVNGKQVVRRSIPDKPLRSNPDQDLAIGRYGGSALGFAEGMLDELRLSSVARTFTEAPRIPYTGKEPGTLALYHFDMLVDGTTCANSVPHSALRSALTGIDGSKLEEGLSGFGSALRMGE